MQLFRPLPPINRGGRLALSTFVFGTCLATTTLLNAVHAAPPASKATNATKGQSQMAGADGRFGTIYTLKSGFNAEILSAHYTLDPLNWVDPVYPAADQKMLVVDIAVKNVNTQDTAFYTSNTYMTAFDEHGNAYKDTVVALDSRADEGGDPKLKPGQGVGQPELHDPLRAVFLVPAKARIVKLIVNYGRKGSAEDVVRYYIAGATQEEAGKAGDPKNVIAPLPPDVRDPADPSGITPVDTGKPSASGNVVSGAFSFHLDSFAYTTDASVTDDNRPADAKQRYGVATITATCLTAGKRTLDPILGNQVAVIDADGNPTRSTYRISAHSATSMDYGRAIKKGATYTFRYVFVVPKYVPQKFLQIGISNGRLWQYDISSTP